jgi:exonuclease SbcC
MKINVIRCKNIHSLKGEHIIYFDRPPLSEAGLFAITGPTGAGKSTILDIITLALFNKIPRFTETGNESVSKNEIEKAGSVITHFTDHAYAEIDYEANGKEYRSTWQISKTRNGNLKDYDMTLATLPDKTPIDLKKSQVPKQNEEILKLTYDQFVRSILLSQGQFAKLLKSDEKERARLLENLTQTAIYRKIGKATFVRCAAEEKEIELLQRDLSNMQLLSEDQIEKLQAEAAVHHEISRRMAVQIEQLNRHLEKHETQQKLTQNLELTKQNLDRLEQDMLQFGQTAEKLRIHEQLQPVAGQLALWKDEMERVRNVQTEIRHAEIRMDESGKLLADHLAQVSLLTGQDASIENYSPLLWQFKDRVSTLDTQLENIKTSGKELAEKITQLLTNAEDPCLVSIQKRSNTKEQQSEAQRILDSLAINPVTTSYTIADLHEIIQQHQKEVPKLASMVETSRQYHLLLKEIQTNEDSLQGHTASLIKLKKIVEERLTDFENVAIENQELKRKKESFLHASKLDDYRQVLEEGQPCPLCGSLHHPYSGEAFLTAYGKLSLLLENAENKLTLLRKQLAETETEISIIQNNFQRETEQKQFLATKLAEFNRQWPELPAVVEAEKIYTDAASKLEILQTELQQRHTIQSLRNLLQLLAELNAMKTTYNLIRNERTQLFAGEDIGQYITAIQSELSTHKDMQNRMVEMIKQKREQVLQAEKKIVQIDQGLTPFLIRLGFNAPFEAINAILPHDFYQKYKGQEEELIQKKVNFQSQVATFQRQFEVLSEELKTIEGSFPVWKDQLTDARAKVQQANHAFGAIQKELENNQQSANTYLEKQQYLEKRRKAAAPLIQLNKYIGDAEGSKFAKFAQNLSLQHLISEANKRLTKLTDRYLLLHTDIEQDLRISDLYQGGTGRSVKTLSGGETFIVSLALALSLSDMASQNVRLDSLFIDEGFGTLDHETLETALATLEKLQSESNRTIGIISHVESLKERITTQIRVLRNAHGYSTLSVESLF